MKLGRGVSEKSDRMTWRSRWTSCFWKFLRKSYWAFPSRNRMWREGTRLEEEEEDPKPRGFWVGVYLCLGAMRSLSEKEKERENIIITRYRNERVRMHEICMNMWRAKNKLDHGLKPNPNLPTNNLNDSKFKQILKWKDDSWVFSSFRRDVVSTL